MKGIKKAISSLIALCLIATSAFAANLEPEVSYPAENTVNVAIKLDETPSDIGPVSAFTIRYTYDESKLTYVSTISNSADITIRANEGNIVWYDDTADLSNAITAEKLSAMDNVLCTITFEKAEGAEGTTDIDIHTTKFSNASLENSASVNVLGATVDLSPDKTAVDEVVAAIDAIGDIEYSDECLARINAAQAAYDALRDDLKERVENYEALRNAWTAYRDSEPKVGKVEDVEGYRGQHIIVVNNVGEDKVVSFGDIKADLVKIGTEIFHVIVTEQTISEQDLVIEDGTPAEHVLGNVMDDSEEIDADDALAANVAAANPDTFADDPMKFVRADVDGSGAITARDALMIAVMAAGGDAADVVKQSVRLHTNR